MSAIIRETSPRSTRRCCSPAAVAYTRRKDISERISAGEGNEQPRLAGTASPLALSLGALIPLLPYLLSSDLVAPTLVITAVALVSGRAAVRTANWPVYAPLGPSRRSPPSAASSTAPPLIHGSGGAGLRAFYLC